MSLQQQRRRLSTCHRHPTADPISGFCPSCLHERLSIIVSPSYSLSSDPDLRRCRSYSSKRHGSLSGESDLRRKSCDVKPRISLSRLFQSDDGNKGSDRTIVIESERLGFSGVEKLGENESELEADKDGKTMKEHIEIEFKLQSKQNNTIWGGAASVFTHKLRKWRLKQKQENKKDLKSKLKIESGSHGLEPKGLMIGRRSCDTELRFSVDDQQRFSLDEPRASWDGYMVARTIPRLAPMLSVIENAMVIEDETNSVSESSSSQRRNSFDCSSSGKSSGKHRMPIEIEQHKESPVAKIIVMGEDKAHVNFNFCEDPLKNSEPASKNADSLKKKVLKILGFKSKSTGTQNGDIEAKFCEKQIEQTNGVGNVVGRKSDVGSYRPVDLHHRSPKASEIRGSATSFERNRSVRYSPSPSNFDNGLLRFHLAPPLSRKKKPERRSVLNSLPNARAMSRLN